MSRLLQPMGRPAANQPLDYAVPPKTAPWRFGRSWPEVELKSQLASLAGRTVNYQVPASGMTRENGWNADGTIASLGVEEPGAPKLGGFYERAKLALVNYDFSDPRIIVGHFDPGSPFIGRNLLLEVKVLGLHYLVGTRVHSVREEVHPGRTVFGFRYDTLEGHFEQGYEWFLLHKDHRSGEIRFEIAAHWRPGAFPNWWSEAGFSLIGEHFRKLWRHRAPGRLAALAHQVGVKPLTEPGHLAHRGDTIPERTAPTEWTPELRVPQL